MNANRSYVNARLGALLFAALSCPLVTGCTVADEITLGQRTSAPATKTGIVDTPYEPDEPSTITMSDGVVLSVGCWDTCDYMCESPTLTVVDGTVLQVHPIQRLDGGRSEHVLVALAPGSTTLTVSNRCATRDYQVRVTEQ